MKRFDVKYWSILVAIVLVLLQAGRILEQLDNLKSIPTRVVILETEVKNINGYIGRKMP